MTTDGGREKPGDVVIGVDIGGTNSVVGFVNEAGTLLLHGRFPTMAHRSAGEFVPRLSEVIGELKQELPAGSRVRAIVIASPAANARNGTVDNPANFKWGRVDLVGMMKKTFDVPISIMNDSDAALLGETRYGVAQGLTNVLLITLGTGLGAGIMMDGRLVQGAHGAAGEFGHMTIIPGGRQCACGRRGCVESYVSASGICRTTFELLEQSREESSLRDLSFETLTAEKVHQCAVKGDPIAKAALEETGKSLGMMLANIVAAFDPEAIVLCGGLVNAGELLIAPARKAFESNVLERYRSTVSILVSRLNNGQAAILGASCQVLDTLYDNSYIKETQP